MSIFLGKYKKTLEIRQKMVYNKMNLLCAELYLRQHIIQKTNGGLQKW